MRSDGAVLSVFTEEEFFVSKSSGNLYFMFQLTSEEWHTFFERSSQIVMTSRPKKNPPYVFTEQGVAMLSSVLKSDPRNRRNITIMPTFVIVRQYLMDYQELSKRIDALEEEMNRKFKDIHEALRYLLAKGGPREIGFKQSSRN